MIVSIEPIWKAINEGIRLRYITDITGDNISYCKMFVENGYHLRHLNGIKSNFAIDGLKPPFIEMISDPYEIQKLDFDLVKSAKEEITILFSTANGFKRHERAGLIQLLQETDPTVKVRILIPAAFAYENAIKGRFDESRILEFRYFLNTPLQTKLTSLTVDNYVWWKN
jgi:hypothetical protein